MNTAPLKSCAPAARGEFLQAVAHRAAHYGLTATKIEPVTVQGDVALIAGEAFPARIAPLRKALEIGVKYRHGPAPTGTPTSVPGTSSGSRSSPSPAPTARPARRSRPATIPGSRATAARLRR